MDFSATVVVDFDPALAVTAATTATSATIAVATANIIDLDQKVDR